MLLFRESIRGFFISFCIISTYSSIISLEPPFDKKKSFLTKPQKKSPKNLHKREIFLIFAANIGSWDETLKLSNIPTIMVLAFTKILART